MVNAHPEKVKANKKKKSGGFSLAKTAGTCTIEKGLRRHAAGAGKNHQKRNEST